MSTRAQNLRWPVLLLLLASACRTTGARGPDELPPTRTPADAIQQASLLKDPAHAAEMLWIEGNDRAAAKARLDQALDQAPNKRPLLLRRALLALERLDRPAALADLLLLLADPKAPEAEAALLLLADFWSEPDAAIQSALGRLLEPTQGAPAGPVALATSLLARFLYTNRDDKALGEALWRGGWLTHFRVVGPIAPPADAAFAEPTRYELGSAPWQPTDLFKGFHPPVRLAPQLAGALLATSGDRPGLYVLETWFELPVAEHVVALEAWLDGSARVAVDGETVLGRDLSLGRDRRRHQSMLRLGPGWHRLVLVTLAAADQRPRISLLAPNGAPIVVASRPELPAKAMRASGKPGLGERAETGAASWEALVDGLVADPERTWFGRFLGASLYRSNTIDDVDRARSLLHPTMEGTPSSAALLAAWARTLRTAGASEGLAQAADREAFSLDASNPAIALSLAESVMRDSPDQAEEALLRAEKLAPHAREVAALELRSFRQRGWSMEAVAALRRARELGADSQTLFEGADLLRSLDRSNEAETIEAEAIERDPREAPAKRADRAIRRGEIDAAIAALRIAGSDPDGAGHLLRIADLELARGHTAEAIRECEAVLLRDPLAGRALRQLVYAQVMAKSSDGAQRALARLIEIGESDLYLEAMAGEQALSPRLQQELVYDPWPEIRFLPGTTTPKGLDATDRWSRYKSVELLDRVVDFVRPGGGALSTRHSVQRLQTKEATDQAGEINLPGEALPLALRTLKPDGQVIDVDRHSGKEDLSFSALAPGDAVERRWVSMEGPATPYGGYLRSYYFKSSEPISRAELIVVTAKTAKVFHHSYHGAPEPEVFDDGEQRVYVFRARDVAALEPEPGSVEEEEYLPFVVVAVDLDPEIALTTNASMLERAHQSSWAVRRTAETLTRGMTDDESRINAVFQFVSRQIGAGDTREPALVLSTRRGDRTPLFAALLRALGLEAEIALARPGSAAQVVPPFPDPSRFGVAVVRVRAPDGRSWWAAFDHKHPWLGKLPPWWRGGEYAIFDGKRLGRSYELLPNEIASWPLSSNVELAVDANGTARGSIAVVLPGSYGSEIRDFLETSRQEDIDRQMQGWVAALVPGARLESLATENRDQPLEPLTLKAQVTIEHFMVRDGAHLIAEQFFGAPLALQSLGLPTLASYLRLPRRETPLLIQELAEQMVVKVQLPPGSNPPVEAPTSFVRKAEYGSFSQQYSYDPARREVVLVSSQQMPFLRLQPAAMTAFAAAAQEILQSMRNRLIVPIPTTPTAAKEQSP